MAAPRPPSARAQRYRVATVVLMVLTLLGVVAGALVARITLNASVSVPATVVGVSEVAVGPIQTYCADLRWEFEGKVYKKQAACHDQPPRIGGQYNVLVNPNNPTFWHLPGSSKRYVPPLTTFVFALGFFIGAIASARQWRKALATS